MEMLYHVFIIGVLTGFEIDIGNGEPSTIMLPT